MLIVLLRHTEREYLATVREADQVLTPDGIKAGYRLGKALAARLKAENRTVSQILCSPYTRATMTAMLVAPSIRLGLTAIELVDSLRAEPEGSATESLPRVIEAATSGVVVVGHEPELVGLCYLLTGLNVEIRKGHGVGIAWDATDHKGTLLWRISPKAEVAS